MRITWITALAFTTISFASCNNGGTNTGTATNDSTAKPKESKEERNLAVIKRGMEAMNAHDIDKMKLDASPDFTEYVDGSMPPVKGDSAWAMFKQYMNAFPDTKCENTKYTATGDWVMAYSDYSCTFKNDMMGMKATGKSCKYKDVDIFKMTEDGKVLEHRSVYPMSAMMALCGVDMSKMPPPDAKKDMKKEKGKM